KTLAGVHAARRRLEHVGARRVEERAITLAIRSACLGAAGTRAEAGVRLLADHRGLYLHLTASDREPLELVVLTFGDQPADVQTGFLAGVLRVLLDARVGDVLAVGRALRSR